MVLVVVPSFWIHEIRMWGPWSWIHLLSIFTLVAFALLIAGVFTLAPGRVMHEVVFGN